MVSAPSVYFFGVLVLIRPLERLHYGEKVNGKNFNGRTAKNKKVNGKKFNDRTAEGKKVNGKKVNGKKFNGKKG